MMNNNNGERVAQMSPHAQVSSDFLIKHLIAQSKIVKQYCMVVLFDMIEQCSETIR